jgi:hypothetical protein
MPVKIARSAPRPSFGLPELLVAIHTSRQSCCKAGKARIFTPVRESSGESRLVFIDETAVSTNMTRLRGRAPRGVRVIGSVPLGRWETRGSAKEGFVGLALINSSQ